MVWSKIQKDWIEWFYLFYFWFIFNVVNVPRVKKDIMLSEKKILRSFYKLFCHLHFLLTVISTYSETIDQKKKQRIKTSKCFTSSSIVRYEWGYLNEEY